MKIGFSILSHKKPDHQFFNLINFLNKFSDREIVVHHDFSKAPFDEIASHSFKLIKPHTVTNWSHHNNIYALLKTFQQLYDKGCEWFITLSANCYPIKSNEYIENFLKSAQYDAFIELNDVTSLKFDFYRYFIRGFETKYLFKIPFVSKYGKFYYKPIRIRRKNTENIFHDRLVPHHGSDWFMINRKVMTYILQNIESVNVITNFLADVNRGSDINVCPPEVVFHTLIANNNQDFKINNNNYRYINWEGTKDWHPNTLTTNHYEMVKKSDALFARKFDSLKSSELIKKIDEEILK